MRCNDFFFKQSSSCGSQLSLSKCFLFKIFKIFIFIFLIGILTDRVASKTWLLYLMCLHCFWGSASSLCCDGGLSDAFILGYIRLPPSSCCWLFPTISFSCSLSPLFRQLLALPLNVYKIFVLYSVYLRISHSYFLHPHLCGLHAEELHLLCVLLLSSASACFMDLLLNPSTGLLVPNTILLFYMLAFIICLFLRLLKHNH